ncbi:hypothetical protein MKW98_017766, partial [Papaver atlanticum]
LTKEEKNNLLIHLLPIQEKEIREYLSVESTVSRRPFRALLDVGILIGGCFEEKELIGDIHRKTNLLHSQQHPMISQITAYSKGSTNKPLTRDVMLEAIDKRGGTLLELSLQHIG